MNRRLIRNLCGAGSGLALVALPQSLFACAACFGRSDDAMAHGMNMGIFTLLIVIVSVLVGIAAVGAFLVHRAGRIAAAAGASAGEESAGTSSSPAQSISQPTH